METTSNRIATAILRFGKLDFPGAFAKFIVPLYYKQKPSKFVKIFVEPDGPIKRVINLINAELLSDYYPIWVNEAYLCEALSNTIVKNGILDSLQTFYEFKRIAVDDFMNLIQTEYELMDKVQPYTTRNFHEALNDLVSLKNGELYHNNSQD